METYLLQNDVRNGKLEYIFKYMRSKYTHIIPQMSINSGCRYYVAKLCNVLSYTMYAIKTNLTTHKCQISTAYYGQFLT